MGLVRQGTKIAEAVDVEAHSGLDRLAQAEEPVTDLGFELDLAPRHSDDAISAGRAAGA